MTMIKKYILLICTALFMAAAGADGSVMNYSVGLYGGFMPSAGGNLHSAAQEEYFSTTSGLDGINKSMDGYSTSEIKRLLAVTGGIELKAIFFDYFFARLAGNYTRSVLGGTGKTLYDDAGTPTLLKCEYTYQSLDIPLTVGLSIPFWKDVTISFSCGAAYARGWTTNKFESSAGNMKGSFSGYTFPLVLLLEGDYFITKKLSLNSSLSYYKGSTRSIRDGKKSDAVEDYSRIDFTGYRFGFGVSYYFFSY
ncbi:MAG TPA: porin OmpL1 [Spirochaetes bacterium]|nr:porin OmpL1 [Spirochaetota bacterium]